jgi:hypothetical protein
MDGNDAIICSDEKQYFEKKGKFLLHKDWK